MTIRHRVEIILRDSAGRALSGINRLGFPVFPGGGVDEGETPFEAAKREIHEETGRNVRNIKEVKGKPLLHKIPNYTSSTTFFSGELAGGKRSKSYGVDNDVLKDMKFRTYDEVKEFTKGNDARDCVKKRLSIMKKKAKDTLPFLAGYGDALRELGVTKKAEVASYLSITNEVYGLNKSVDELAKQASPYKTLLGAGLGAGLGGAFGYAMTNEEKDKIKNALIGAIVGAPLGGLLASGSTEGKTEKKDTNSYAAGMRKRKLKPRPRSSKGYLDK